MWTLEGRCTILFTRGVKPGNMDIGRCLKGGRYRTFRRGTHPFRASAKDGSRVHESPAHETCGGLCFASTVVSR